MTRDFLNLHCSLLQDYVFDLLFKLIEFLPVMMFFIAEIDCFVILNWKIVILY